MKSKLHRVRITECKPDYMGSLGIDRRWMERVGLLPLQEIHCWNLTRGTRFVTYAIPARAGSREISPNGACAHLCEEGDLLIIAAFWGRSVGEVRAAGHTARVLLFGTDFEPSQYVEQELVVDGDRFEFVSTEKSLTAEELSAGTGAAA